jgi:hypothetical protein
MEETDKLLKNLFQIFNQILKYFYFISNFFQLNSCKNNDIQYFLRLNELLKFFSFICLAFTLKLFTLKFLLVFNLLKFKVKTQNFFFLFTTIY